LKRAQGGDSKQERNCQPAPASKYASAVPPSLRKGLTHMPLTRTHLPDQLHVDHLQATLRKLVSDPLAKHCQWKHMISKPITVSTKTKITQGAAAPVREKSRKMGPRLGGKNRTKWGRSCARKIGKVRPQLCEKNRQSAATAVRKESRKGQPRPCKKNRAK
jgi:hypothetical protein